MISDWTTQRQYARHDWINSQSACSVSSWNTAAKSSKSVMSIFFALKVLGQLLTEVSQPTQRSVYIWEITMQETCCSTYPF